MEADGSLLLSWVQRSRRGWAWLDEVEVPPDPDVTGYRVTVSSTAGMLEYSVAEPTLTIAAVVLAGLGGGPLDIAARQVGSLTLSRPATITIQP